MASKGKLLLSIITRSVVSIILVAVAIVVFAMLWNTKPQPERSDRGEEAPRVLVMRAQPVAVRRQWSGYGTAHAMDTADVPARVTATVESIPDDVVAGARVERGELLVRLDASDFLRQEEIARQAIADLEAQLARIEIELRSWRRRVELAEEQVELATAEFERVQNAFEKGVAKQREVDQARQALISAIRDETSSREELDKVLPRKSSLEAQKLAREAELRIAVQNVERCAISSPLDGVLQSVDVEVGENLAAGQRVARVVSLDRIEVPLQVPANARGSLEISDPVTLRSTGGGARSWDAQIARIAPENDQSTRTMSVYVELRQAPDSPDLLAPGQFVRGTVRSSETEQRWVVPRRALADDRIFAVNDGTIASRRIEIDYQVAATFPELGPADEQWVVLRDPLPEGALVVVNASRGLPDGLRVEPVPIDETGDLLSSGGPPS